MLIGYDSKIFPESEFGGYHLKFNCNKLKSSGWHPEKILLIVLQKLFAGVKLDSVFVETIGFIGSSHRHIET
jgi:hypothetical protein